MLDLMMMMQSARRTNPLKFSADLTSTAKVLTPAKGTGPGTFTGGGQWVADNAGVLQFVAAGNPAIPGSRIVGNTCYDTLADGTPITGIKGVLLETVSTNKVTGYNVITADSLGVEKLTNGGFDTDTVWSKLGTSTISGGVGNVSGNAGQGFTIPATVVIGRKYRVTFTLVSRTTGSVGIQGTGANVVAGTAQTVPGTYTIDYTAPVTTFGIVAGANSTVAVVDNVSLKEIVLAVGTTAASSSTGAITGLTLSGDTSATVSIVDGTADTLAGGAQNISTSGKLYKLDNTSGSTDAFVAFAGTVGNTNPHSISILAYKTAGTPQIQLSSGEGAVDITSGTLARYTSNGITPGATSRTMRVKAPAGAVVFFSAFQLEELPFSTSPIITSGATATRAAAILTEPVANLRGNNISGSVDWTPTMTSTTVRWLWGAYTNSNNYYGLFRDGAAGTLVFRKRVAGVNYDASYTIAVTPGTTYKVGWRMGAAGVDIFVNGVKGTGNANTTDAAVPTAWQLGADGNSANQGTPQIKNLRIYWDDASDAKMIQRTT